MGASASVRGRLYAARRLCVTGVDSPLAVAREFVCISPACAQCHSFGSFSRHRLQRRRPPFGWVRLRCFARLCCKSFGPSTMKELSEGGGPSLTILKINGLSVITDDVVEAARSTLVIGVT